MAGERILLVDDDPDIRTIGQLSLARIGGMHVTLAAGGRAALELLEVSRFDAVLLDMMMPEIDGRAVLAHLRRMPEHATLPVIFLTAKVQDREVQEFMQLGATGVLGKPFDPMKLAEQVRGLLADGVH